MSHTVLAASLVEPVGVSYYDQQWSTKAVGRLQIVGRVYTVQCVCVMSHIRTSHSTRIGTAVLRVWISAIGARSAAPGYKRTRETYPPGCWRVPFPTEPFVQRLNNQLDSRPR